MESINKTIYPLQRFKIMGYLCQVENANYGAIREFTGLSDPEISRTVKALQEKEYVYVHKDRSGKYAETVVRATSQGRKEFLLLVSTLRKYAG